MSDTPEPQASALESVRPIELEDQFYEFLAGGSKLFLLCAMVDMGLPQLLAAAGPQTVEEITEKLGLQPVRARKFALLLRSVGLLTEKRDGDATRYDNGPLAHLLGGAPGANAYFYREFLRYFRTALAYEMVSLVRGAHVAYPVRYPPVDWADVVLLHEWMRDGALVTLATIERHFKFSDVTDVLDVGGGDATMAVALARSHPHLRITVFNLPQPAELARKNIREAGLEARVQVVEGDFRTDELPEGFDLVMFSRVMADWDEAVCRLLMRKAAQSLRPWGLILIAEPLRDQNPNLALAWEHSYLPYDDFGAFVYKPLGLYEQMLRESGYTDIVSFPRDADSIHAVIVAQRGQPAT
jgi:SAM-dependent methyltransferase